MEDRRESRCRLVTPLLESNWPASTAGVVLRDGVTVARLTLNQLVQVRILAPQPDQAHSSSGPGRRPLKAEITGSNPVCATTLYTRNGPSGPFFGDQMATNLKFTRDVGARNRGWFAFMLRPRQVERMVSAPYQRLPVAFSLRPSRPGVLAVRD